MSFLIYITIFSVLILSASVEAVGRGRGRSKAFLRRLNSGKAKGPSSIWTKRSDENFGMGNNLFLK